MYKRENEYNTIIADVVAQYGNGRIDIALVKAIIGAESSFTPTAIRQEVKINDASRGLMQILYRTAKSVGYTGTADGLFDPRTNITYGVKFLSDLLRAKSGDTWAAVSAYNNGNGKRATTTTTVCLERDQTTGKCVRSFTAKPGEFFNQPYVDKVRTIYAYFTGQSKPLPGSATTGGIALAWLGAGIWIAAKYFRGL